MNIYAIYGSSGFGREVIPLAKKNLDLKDGASKIVFVDDNPLDKNINGYEVMSWSQFSAASCNTKHVNVAIGDSKVREGIVIKCANANVKFFNVVAENFVQLDANIIGEGAILTPFSMLTSNTKIGKHFHLNIYSYVAHDCVIGDYVTLAPGVKCNGNVIIEDHAYIGTGAIIKQGTPAKPLIIGSRAIVGAGAVVTKNVLAGTTVVGNPAREMVKG